MSDDATERNPLVSDEFDALLAAALRFADSLRAWLDSHVDAAMDDRDSIVVANAEVEGMVEQFKGEIERYSRAALVSLLRQRETLTTDEARELGGRFAYGAAVLGMLSSALFRTADEAEGDG